MTDTWNTTFWLARRQVRDIWTSYLYTAFYFALMGFAMAVGDALFSDVAHLFLMMILIQPVISSRYMSWKLDNDLLRSQLFLRSMPLPIGVIVRSRLLMMLLAGVINIPLYMLPFWFQGSHFDRFTSFLAWAVFWTGIALSLVALSIVQEFSLSLRRWSIMNIVLIAIIAVIFALLYWQLDFRPLAWSEDFAAESPLLAIAIGVIVGAISLIASDRLGSSALRRRDLAL